MKKIIPSLLLILLAGISYEAHAAAKKTQPCASILSSAKVQEGYFIQSQGYPIYYKNYKAPRSKGQMVISNGLRYELSNFDQVIEKFVASGYSVLVYAHRTQHESSQAAEEKKLKFEDLTLEELTQDLEELIVHLKIKKKINLIGLSFGSTISAAYADRNPEKVETLTLWAPLVRLASMYLMMRDWGMAPRYSDSSEAMIDAIKRFDLNDFEFQVPVSLVLAEKDDAYLMSTQKSYWQNTLQNQGGEITVIPGAHHGLPTSAPEKVAKILIDFINRTSKPKTGTL